MDEYYDIIEKKIRAAGYEGEVNGFGIYEEISDQIEEKEIGSYLFLSKKEDSVYFEYKVDILEDEFNLSYIDIHEEDKIYHVNFDE